jgi:tRNA modification GTPase
MIPHTQDTIVALSSAPGPGGRAIVRLSGPRSAAVVSTLFSPVPPLPARRCLVEGELRLPGVAAPLPADLYLWPAPHSYTGQAMAEIHTPGCPPLVDLLVAELLRGGARAAQAGEFTLRAFLGGKLDLTRAEAVHGVIESSSRGELKQALGQLAGGMARPLQELRDDLLNLLADVEAALDFADEDIRFVGQEEMLLRIAKGLAQVTVLGKQLAGRALGERPFRVVLAGEPNVGKSSLFNALAGASALVSPEPGTTRDYLTRTIALGEVRIELIDTPGRQPAGDAITAQAQALGRAQAEDADLVLLCWAADSPAEPVVAPSVWPGLSPRSPGEAPRGVEDSTPATPLKVATKCDLATAPAGWLATSAVSGLGLDALRALLKERARARREPALAPSVSRCRHHVEACLEHLRRAHAVALYEDPPELLALALRETLEELGEMVGAVYTDDLLDRIFSRFCIGK